MSRTNGECRLDVLADLHGRPGVDAERDDPVEGFPADPGGGDTGEDTA